MKQGGGMSDSLKYRDVYEQSINQPDSFWGKAAEAVQWTKKWDKVLDESKKPFYSWFTGGELNTCYNALDYHVESGRKDQVAIIYDSPVTKIQLIKLATEELLDGFQICGCAFRIRRHKRRYGDHLYADDPAGHGGDAGLRPYRCLHSVVFGGFAPMSWLSALTMPSRKSSYPLSCGIEGKKRWHTNRLWTKPSTLPPINLKRLLSISVRR